MAAYGASGTGKTHTLLDDSGGILFRLAIQIFECLSNCDPAIEFTVRCSAIEIYLERLRDLLQESSKVRLKAIGRSGVVLAGCSALSCVCAGDVVGVVQRAAAARTCSAADPNRDSSRSSCLVQLQIEQLDTRTGVRTTSRLHILDLVASELAHLDGRATLEAAQVSHSLKALHKHVRELRDGKQAAADLPAVTKLLTSSLSGECCAHTTFILTASPSNYAVQETANTLRFGLDCRQLTTCPVVHVIDSVDNLDATDKFALAQEKNDRLELLAKALACECKRLRDHESGDRLLWPIIHQISAANDQARKLDFSIETRDEHTIKVERVKLYTKLKKTSEQRDEAFSERDQMSSDLAILQAQNIAVKESHAKLLADMAILKHEKSTLQLRKCEVEHNLRTSQYRESEAVVFLRQLRRFYYRLLKKTATDGTGDIPDISKRIPGAPDLVQLVDIDHLMMESGLLEKSDMGGDVSVDCRPSREALDRSTAQAELAAAKALKMETDAGRCVAVDEADRIEYVPPPPVSIVTRRESADKVEARQKLYQTPSGLCVTMREKMLEEELLQLSEINGQLRTRLDEEKANVEALVGKNGVAVAYDKVRAAQETRQLKEQLARKNNDLKAVIWKMNELHMIGKMLQTQSQNREQHVGYLEENLEGARNQNGVSLAERQADERRSRDEIRTLQHLVESMSVPVWHLSKAARDQVPMPCRLVVPFTSNVMPCETVLGSNGSTGEPGEWMEYDYSPSEKNLSDASTQTLSFPTTTVSTQTESVYVVDRTKTTSIAIQTDDVNFLNLSQGITDENMNSFMFMASPFGQERSLMHGSFPGLQLESLMQDNADMTRPTKEAAAIVRTVDATVVDSLKIDPSSSNEGVAFRSEARAATSVEDFAMAEVTDNNKIDEVVLGEIPEFDFGAVMFEDSPIALPRLFARADRERPSPRRSPQKYRTKDDVGERMIRASDIHLEDMMLSVSPVGALIASRASEISDAIEPAFSFHAANAKDYLQNNVAPLAEENCRSIDEALSLENAGKQTVCAIDNMEGNSSVSNGGPMRLISSEAPSGHHANFGVNSDITPSGVWVIAEERKRSLHNIQTQGDVGERGDSTSDLMVGVMNVVVSPTMVHSPVMESMRHLVLSKDAIFGAEPVEDLIVLSRNTSVTSTDEIQRSSEEIRTQKSTDIRLLEASAVGEGGSPHNPTCMQTSFHTSRLQVELERTLPIDRVLSEKDCSDTLFSVEDTSVVEKQTYAEEQTPAELKPLAEARRSSDTTSYNATTLTERATEPKRCTVSDQLEAPIESAEMESLNLTADRPPSNRQSAFRSQSESPLRASRGNNGRKLSSFLDKLQKQTQRKLDDDEETNTPEFMKLFRKIGNRNKNEAVLEAAGSAPARDATRTSFEQLRHSSQSASRGLSDSQHSPLKKWTPRKKMKDDDDDDSDSDDSFAKQFMRGAQIADVPTKSSADDENSERSQSDASEDPNDDSDTGYPKTANAQPMSSAQSKSDSDSDSSANEKVAKSESAAVASTPIAAPVSRFGRKDDSGSDLSDGGVSKTPSKAAASERKQVQTATSPRTPASLFVKEDDSDSDSSDDETPKAAPKPNVAATKPVVNAPTSTACASRFGRMDDSDSDSSDDEEKKAPAKTAKPIEPASTKTSATASRSVRKYDSDSDSSDDEESKEPAKPTAIVKSIDSAAVSANTAQRSVRKDDSDSDSSDDEESNAPVIPSTRAPLTAETEIKAIKTMPYFGRKSDSDSDSDEEEAKAATMHAVVAPQLVKAEKSTATVSLFGQNGDSEDSDTASDEESKATAKSFVIATATPTRPAWRMGRKDDSDDSDSSGDEKSKAPAIDAMIALKPIETETNSAVSANRFGRADKSEDSDSADDVESEGNSSQENVTKEIGSSESEEESSDEESSVDTATKKATAEVESTRDDEESGSESRSSDDSGSEVTEIIDVTNHKEPKPDGKKQFVGGKASDAEPKTKVPDVASKVTSGLVAGKSNSTPTKPPAAAVKKAKFVVRDGKLVKCENGDEGPAKSGASKKAAFVIKDGKLVKAAGPSEARPAFFIVGGKLVKTKKEEPGAPSDQTPKQAKKKTVQRGAVKQKKKVSGV